MKLNKIYHGDTRELLKNLPDKSIDCCVTSPPYWGLRDYGVDDQIGLEKTPEKFVETMVLIFREVRRVLKTEGTLWLNLGDSYASNGKNRSENQAVLKSSLNGGMSTQCQSLKQQSKIVSGLKPKDLIGIPWRVALALQEDGWWLRQDIIWHKPNPMPESVTDRCTKSHEYMFLLSKSKRYYFDNKAIKEPVGQKGNAKSFRGGCYINGNRDNALLGKRTVAGNSKVKIPSGWDTEPGSHGTFHRKGRADSKHKTHGKHSGQDKNSAGRRIVENVKKARAAGAAHDSPFGEKRNKRSVWTVATYPYKKAHFATFPAKLIEPCVLAGCPKDGVVLDPFMGSGTTGFVARENNRNFIGFELNEDYIKIANDRIKNAEPQLVLEGG